MKTSFQEPRPTSAEGSLDLREFLHKVARRKWLVLGVVVIVASLAAAYSYTRPSVYAATAKVWVRPILTHPDDTDPLDNLSMPTEAQLVTSTDVARIARARAGLSEPIADLIGRVSVTTPENTQILQITFTDDNADDARAGAQQFAQGYLEFKTEEATNAIEDDAATVSALILEVEAEIQDLDEQIQDLTVESPAWSIAKSDRRSAEARRKGLLDQLTAITTLSTDPGEVLQAAERPSVPISPRHQVDLSLGLLLGLAAGVTLASVREQLQDRIEDPGVLRKYLKAPTLGLIPESSLLRGDMPRLVTIDEPRSAPAEAYRTLRTNLLAVAKTAKARTVLVTGARQGEGKTTTAANLAVALAQVGRTVILISADLRFPRLHSLLGVGNEQGLGQVLLGTRRLDEALVETAIANLVVLPSGPVSGDEPVELLQSDRMFEVIRACRQADFVIVDGPPIEPVADSLVLADLVDGVLLVADARGTRAGVSNARQQLEQVGGSILGGVLNRVPESRTPEAYGAYEQRRGLADRSRSDDDADRELASLREEASRSPETSAWV